MAAKKKTKADAPLADQLGWVAAAPKLSSAVDPKKLPVLVGTAATLDAAMTATVLRALASAKTDASLVVALRRDTTAESRDALGLELLEVWKNKEFHGRLGWIMDAIGALGGDRSIMALAAHVATWPSDGDTGRKRAIGAAPVLAHANTNTAILELIGLRQSAVVPTVLEATISALQHVVRARHTTLSELFDVVTPTLDLDPNGTRTFAHAGKTYTVAFDDHFEPRLRNDAGTLEDLDEEPAWKVIAAQLRDAVKVQTFRLEHDMIAGRRWRTSEWTRLLRDHPLLVSFTRRLVWGVYSDTGALIKAFRTADDRTLLTRDGETTLEADDTIGLVHPLHLDDDARARWSESLADYEIIQPFAQLGRPVFHVEATERESTMTARFATSRFKSGVLRDMLVRAGWERDSALLRKEYERYFPTDDVWAIATMDPGVQAGSATYEEYDQTIASIEFRDRKGGGRSTTPMQLYDVPPIAFSEAVHDIAEVLAAQDTE